MADSHVIDYNRRMRTALTNSLRIHALATYDTMSRRAADFICGELERRPNLLLCVSTGGPPTGAYDSLADDLSPRP